MTDSDLITFITSEPQFDQILATKNKLIVVNFFATWCGPCRLAAPKLKKMASDFKDAIFCKIDIDENQSLATRFVIRAMPTYMVFKDGEEIGTIVGANLNKVAALLRPKQSVF